MLQKQNIWTKIKSNFKSRVPELSSYALKHIVLFSKNDQKNYEASEQIIPLFGLGLGGKAYLVCNTSFPFSDPLVREQSQFQFYTDTASSAGCEG